LDAVLLNEVAQHFPGVDYLLRVLEKAIALVKPCGFVFIGGVRNLRLLKAFHTSVQLFQATNSMTKNELMARIRNRIRLEKDLVIDPSLFSKLRFPGVTSVHVHLKKGRQWNEITCFKYDVVLSVRQEVAFAKDPLLLEWGRQVLSLGEVQRILHEKNPE